MADGLARASELRLVTRFHNDTLNTRETHAYGVWGDPALHQHAAGKPD